MDSMSKKLNYRELIKILPGILFSLTAFILILFIVDWDDVAIALKQAEFSFLILGIPIYLIAYLCRAIAWQTILGRETPFKKVFLTMQIGYLLNNILPFRLGELGRALLLGRTGLGFWRVFSTILIERTFDMILAVSLLLGTIPFVIGGSQYSQAAIFVGILVLFGVAILYLLARNQGWVVDRYKKLGEKRPAFSRVKVERVESFIQGLSSLNKFPVFLRIFGWMVMSWGFAAVYQFVVFLAFDPEAKLLWTTFGLSVASLGVALPSSPSYVGVLEAAWIGALSLFKIPLSIALAYAVTVHILHIIISLVFGTFGLLREGETLSKLFSELRNRNFEKDSGVKK